MNEPSQKATAAPSVAVRLNTPAVANRGLVIGGLAIAIKIAADIAAAHLPESSSARIALADINTYFATPALAGGLLSAYLGRPSTLPS